MMTVPVTHNQFENLNDLLAFSKGEMDGEKMYELGNAFLYELAELTERKDNKDAVMEQFLRNFRESWRIFNWGKVDCVVATMTFPTVDMISPSGFHVQGLIIEDRRVEAQSDDPEIPNFNIDIARAMNHKITRMKFDDIKASVEDPILKWYKFVDKSTDRCGCGKYGAGLNVTSGKVNDAGGLILDV